MSGTDSQNPLRRPAWIGRAGGPWRGLLPDTQGVALGWYGDGPLALETLQATQSPLCLFSLASLPSSAPKAPIHISLGRRPRLADTNILRAESPTHSARTP